MLNQTVATSQERWLVFLVQWVLASAIFDLILAAIILAGPSGTARWALGLLIAINLTLGGLALIVMAGTPTAFHPSVRLWRVLRVRSAISRKAARRRPF